MAAITAVAVALAMTAVQVTTALPTQGGKFIVGGTAAKEGDFPYIVAALLGGAPTAAHCGGTLLNANTVLTAAHCTEPDLSRLQIRAGSLAWASGGILVNVSSSIVHPEYNVKTLDNDIALWKLATPIEISSTIAYGKLPEKGSDPATDSIATVAGWGRMAVHGPEDPYPKILQKVSVPVVARDTCTAAYQKKKKAVTDNMFCAGFKEGGKDACLGDSGGPIIDADTGVLIGTTSWGVGCAAPDAYGVYARVANYIDFINSNL